MLFTHRKNCIFSNYSKLRIIGHTWYIKYKSLVDSCIYFSSMIAFRKGKYFLTHWKYLHWKYLNRKYLHWKYLQWKYLHWKYFNLNYLEWKSLHWRFIGPSVHINPNRIKHGSRIKPPRQNPPEIIIIIFLASFFCSYVVSVCSSLRSR